MLTFVILGLFNTGNIFRISESSDLENERLAPDTLPLQLELPELLGHLAQLELPDPLAGPLGGGLPRRLECKVKGPIPIYISIVQECRQRLGKLKLLGH